MSASSDIERFAVLVGVHDAANRSAIAGHLRGCGYRVRETSTAAGAVHQVEKGHYDLVVLDWELYRADGEDGLVALRRRSAVPVVIVTGLVESSNRLRVLDLTAHDRLSLGAEDYVVQPCSLTELEARIGAVLRRSRSTATAVRRSGATPS